jgi:hypothetical protein
MKKKPFIKLLVRTICTLFLFFPIEAISQSPIERGFGTPEDDIALALCKTTDNGYAVAGYTRGYSPSLTMFPFIVKFNNDGQHVWSTYLPTSQNFAVTGIVEDPAGNLIGCSRSNYIQGEATDSIYVFKLDPTGNLIWDQYHTGGAHRICSELALAPSGNILIAGTRKLLPNTGSEASVMVLNNSGQLIAEKIYDSYGDNGFTDVVKTADGNYVFCSAAYDSLSNDYAFLVKTNSAGDSLWTRNKYLTTHPQNHISYVNAITETGTYDLVVGGSVGNPSYNHAFLLHLDMNGIYNMNANSLAYTNLIADNIEDLAYNPIWNEVYAVNDYYNFGSHFNMVNYSPTDHSVFPYFEYLRVMVSTFDVDYHSRNANAIIDDTQNFNNLVEVMAGSTTLSGYGKEDFALVRTNNLGATINSPAPKITLHGNDYICIGDSVLITLDTNKRDFHRWANIADIVLDDTADYDLGVYGDSLWVKDRGYYMCIAFDNDSNIYCSNVIKINFGLDTIKIESTLAPLFCAAAGQHDSTVLYVSNLGATMYPVTYQWYKGNQVLTGETDSFYVAKTSGLYYCKGTSLCGGWETNRILVSANASPNELYDVTVIAQLLSACSTQVVGWIGYDTTSTFTWYDSTMTLLPNTTSSMIPGIPTTLYGVAENACGKDSVVFKTRLNYDLFPNDTAYQNCLTGGVYLRVDNSKPATSNISWYLNGNLIPGISTDTMTVFLPGNYEAHFEDTLCPGAINIQVCQVFPAPALVPFTIMASDTLVCMGEPFPTITVPVVPNATYRLYRNDTLIYTSSSPGPYIAYPSKNKVEISDGCNTVSDSITIVYDTTVVTAMAMGPTSFCQGDSVQLTTDPDLISWQWYRRSSLIPGAVSWDFYAKVTGKYYCIAYDSLGCPDTSNTITVNVPCIPVGPSEERVDLHSAHGFEVFPNPAHDLVTIIADPGFLMIYDMYGKAVADILISGPEYQLDVSHLASGSYVFSYRTGDNVYRKMVQVH